MEGAQEEERHGQWQRGSPKLRNDLPAELPLRVEDQGQTTAQISTCMTALELALAQTKFLFQCSNVPCSCAEIQLIFQLSQNEELPDPGKLRCYWH